MFVCLYETERWSRSSLNLVFWTNLRSLITIRKSLVGNSIKFYWKQRNTKDHYIMELEIEDTNEVVELILEKMEKFGINYKITKQSNAPKQGEIPKIDIENVEIAITNLESRISDHPEQAEVEYLMDLYSKVINNNYK